MTRPEVLFSTHLQFLITLYYNSDNREVIASFDFTFYSFCHCKLMHMNCKRSQGAFIGFIRIVNLPHELRNIVHNFRQSVRYDELNQVATALQFFQKFGQWNCPNNFFCGKTKKYFHSLTNSIIWICEFLETVSFPFFLNEYSDNRKIELF